MDFSLQFPSVVPCLQEQIMSSIKTQCRFTDGATGDENDLLTKGIEYREENMNFPIISVLCQKFYF